MVLLFELPLCTEALGKNFCFAMWPLGRPAGAGWENSGEARWSLAGEGREEGLGVTRVLFGNSVSGERLPVGGAPTANGGSRRGCPTGDVGARLGLWTGRRAMVGAGEVEEGPPWLADGRDWSSPRRLGLGTGGGSVGRRGWFARRGGEQRPL
jgi:hypothetical protein